MSESEFLNTSYYRRFFLVPESLDSLRFNEKTKTFRPCLDTSFDIFYSKSGTPIFFGSKPFLYEAKKYIDWLLDTEEGRLESLEFILDAS